MPSPRFAHQQRRARARDALAVLHVDADRRGRDGREEVHHVRVATELVDGKRPSNRRRTHATGMSIASTRSASIP